jgi:hypothetical protein
MRFIYLAQLYSLATTHGVAKEPMTSNHNKG